MGMLSPYELTFGIEIVPANSQCECPALLRFEDLSQFCRNFQVKNWRGCTTIKIAGLIDRGDFDIFSNHFQNPFLVRFRLVSDIHEATRLDPPALNSRRLY